MAKKKLKLMDHQLSVADMIKGDNDGGLVFHGLGAGKTFSSINAASNEGLPLIAIVPASLRENYQKELEAVGYDGDFEVMSYNKASKLMNDKEFKDRVENSFVVYDEAHNMGQQTSARSSIPKKLSPRKSLALTGTPIRNRPSELVPILAAIKAKDAPLSVKEFNNKFLTTATRDRSISAFQRARNYAKGDHSLRAKNIDEFKRMIEGKINYYEHRDPALWPDVEDQVVQVPMDNKHLNIYTKMMNKNKWFKYKVEHDIPPNKMEISKMQNFLVGPRMAANTPSVVSDEATHNDSNKILRMVKDIVDIKKKHKKAKTFVYSNFLDAGVKDVARALDEKGISNELFTGELDDKKKKAVVKKYNDGKVDVLLASGAGAEGLDLKGTRLVQIMEPHWNSARVNQAIGRAIRLKSHVHLPKKDRNVKVKRYMSTLPVSWFSKLFGRGPRSSVDSFLVGMSKRKDNINNKFLRAMVEVSEESRMNKNAGMLDSEGVEIMDDTMYNIRMNKIAGVLRDAGAAAFANMKINQYYNEKGALYRQLSDVKRTHGSIARAIADTEGKIAVGAILSTLLAMAALKQKSIKAGGAAALSLLYTGGKNDKLNRLKELDGRRLSKRDLYGI